MNTNANSKYAKYLGTVEKVGKIVLKAVLAIGSVAILNYLNTELGQFGVKIDYNNGDIHVGADKKPEKRFAGNGGSYGDKPKPKTLDTLTYPDTPQTIAILALSNAAKNAYSSSSKLDAAKKIFSIGMEGDSDTIRCAVNNLRVIANDAYSSSVKEYCFRAIGDLGITANELAKREAEANVEPGSGDNGTKETESSGDVAKDDGVSGKEAKSNE